MSRTRAAFDAGCCASSLTTTYAYDCPTGQDRGPVNDDYYAYCPSDLICCEKADSPLPTAGWTAHSDSEETRKENGRAKNVLDGDTATIWHSRWSRKAAPLPHYIEIVFGGDTHTVSGLRCAPSAAGLIKLF